MNVLGKKSTIVVLFFSSFFRAIDIFTYMMKRLKPARVDKERRITPTPERVFSKEVVHELRQKSFDKKENDLQPVSSS